MINDDLKMHFASLMNDDVEWEHISQQYWGDLIFFAFSIEVKNNSKNLKSN